jgi:hypothetical protein
MRPLLDNVILDNLARDLRAATLGSDHETAARLSVAYSTALRQHWSTLSSEQRAASSLPKRSIELLNWVRDMTLMQHAIAAEHLSLAQRASRALAARALYLETSALDARR